jgi:hypothetical protein
MNVIEISSIVHFYHFKLHGDRLCGLVVRVLDYRCRGPGFDSRFADSDHGLSPRANYTDRATAACRRSDCQLLRIEGATWSA